MQKKRLIRGQQNFKGLIDRNGYFVDKSLLIQEVIDDANTVILLPRPRRFGKSLNLSMLSHFFNIQKPENETLFEPYKIWQTGAYYTEQQGKYPIIHISLKGIEKSTYKDCMEKIKIMLSGLFNEYYFLLGSNQLFPQDKKDIQAIISRTASSSILQEGLRKLSQYLYKHYQQQVVVLIDEYDAPIHAGYKYGYYDKIIEFMRSFLGGALKGNEINENEVIYKSVITGILRVSKESIFSGVNNIEAYTLLDSDYADKFGFTEEETKKILTHFQLSKYYENVKQWYDGYHIGDLTDIYNPWSITGFISKKEKEFISHWVNTSSDELIKERVVEKKAKTMRKDIETLLLGKTISKTLESNMVFRDFDTNKELFWTLLTFSGYLTPVEKEDDELYSLKIPNYEIYTLFRKIILRWLQTGLNVTHSLLLKMFKALTSNRIREFEKHFKAVMGDIMSYFDPAKNPEAVWQAYVLGLLSIAKDNYIIRSNRESGHGRYDILMLPKNKTKYGIVIEIKSMAKEATQKEIEDKLEEALGQIQKNEYYQELIAHNIPKRIEIAVVFVGKKVFLLPKNQ